MIAHKHISKIIIAITALAVILCFAAIAYADELTVIMGGTAVKMEYEKKLFDTSEPMELNIIMDDSTWDTMLANAMSEEYYVCDVVINGKRVNNVAIRPKGNTSLSAIAMDPDTNRFSMKLEFDHFVDGQTCYGLDKLILNNNYADATNMKEAVIYDMYQYLGAYASLYNYAKVSVNGEYWGVYLALEGVEQSFMLRNFGTQDGELYKPDTMEMGGDNAGGGFAMGGGGGANLNYTDDDLDSYSTIWSSEITGTSKNDHRRVVTALKNISEGTDLETYLDVDNVLKYMAVHTFAVNLDSLSGSMSHNYYLYEYNGQLNIFPWDYNLSFGGFSMGSAGDGTSVINDAIDTPFSGTKFFNSLLSDEEYLARYHAYLQQLTDEYVEGGKFDEFYSRVRTQIDSLVAEDPTAFYTAEEYGIAAEVLHELIVRRAESIEGQIAGTIPSTDSAQKADSSALIDGSDIDVSLMGEFSMGGGMGGGFNKAPGGGFGGFGGGAGNGTGEQTGDGTAENSDAQGQGRPDGAPGSGGGQGMPSGDFDPGNMPSGDFDPNNMPSGDFDFGNFDPNNMPADFDFSNMPDMGDFDFSNFDPNSMPGGFTPGGNSGDSGSDSGSGAGGGMPSFGGSGMPGGTMNMSKIANIASLAGCLVLVLVSLLVLKFIRPKG
jgi:spore coat protein CotH